MPCQENYLAARAQAGQLIHLKSVALPTAKAGTRKTVLPPRETLALHAAVFTKGTAYMSTCTGKSNNNRRPYSTPEI